MEKEEMPGQETRQWNSSLPAGRNWSIRSVTQCLLLYLCG